MHLEEVARVHRRVGHPAGGDLVERHEADPHQQRARRLEDTCQVDLLDLLVAADENLAERQHRDARRPRGQAARGDMRRSGGHVDRGDAVRRIALGHEQRRLVCIEPGEEERRRQAGHDLVPRARTEVEAADASARRRLLADVGALEVGGEHDADRVLEARENGGLRAARQVDAPETAGSGELDDVRGMVCLVEEHLLRRGHSRRDDRRRRAVRACERDPNEVAAPLGDVGVRTVGARLHVLRVRVAGAEHRVGRVEVIRHPLELKVVAVRDDLDLRVVARGRTHREDVVRRQLVRRVVVADDRRRRVREARERVRRDPTFASIAPFCGTRSRRIAVFCSHHTSAPGPPDTCTPASKSKCHVPCSTAVPDETIVPVRNRLSRDSFPLNSTNSSWFCARRRSQPIAPPSPVASVVNDISPS